MFTELADVLCISFARHVPELELWKTTRGEIQLYHIPYVDHRDARPLYSGPLLGTISQYGNSFCM